MPSITTLDGYTFSNWGPVTTTFTAPASCATATDNMRIGLNTTSAFWMYADQCSTFAYYDCVPTGTAKPTITYDANPTGVEDYSYFSPGLDCPAGWNTVGVAARDTDKSLSASGLLKPTVTVPAHSFIPQWENPVTLLENLLDPGETAVVCCPRYGVHLFLRSIRCDHEGDICLANTYYQLHDTGHGLGMLLHRPRLQGHNRLLSRLAQLGCWRNDKDIHCEWDDGPSTPANSGGYVSDYRDKDDDI